MKGVDFRLLLHYKSTKLRIFRNISWYWNVLCNFQPLPKSQYKTRYTHCHLFIRIASSIVYTKVQWNPTSELLGLNFFDKNPKSSAEYISSVYWNVIQTFKLSHTSHTTTTQSTKCQSICMASSIHPTHKGSNNLNRWILGYRFQNVATFQNVRMDPKISKEKQFFLIF